MGLFGVTIPEEYGGLGLDLLTYALIQIELSRGWMTLSGVLNTHFISAWMIRTHGTDEQRERYLPRMATGELRFAYSMTEPHAGSDVQAIRTRAVRDGDEYVDHRPEDVGDQRAARRGDHAARGHRPGRRPAAPGMTAFVVEKEPEAGRAARPRHLRDQLASSATRASRRSSSSSTASARRPRACSAAKPARAQGFDLLHGRDRARPREHRRARGRDRHTRIRGGDPLRAGARDVRQADRPAPGGAAEAGADGDEDRGGTAPHHAGGGDARAPASAPTSRPGWRSCSRPRPPRRSRSRRCGSTAATATRRSSSSSGSTATRPLLILGEGSNEIQQLVIARRLLERHARLMDFALPPELRRDPRRGARAVRAASPASTGARSSPTATRRSSSRALTEQRVAGRADPRGVRRRRAVADRGQRDPRGDQRRRAATRAPATRRCT